MEVIVKGRAQGKTHELMLLSSVTRKPILTTTREQVQLLKARAYAMHIDLPEPFTVFQAFRRQPEGTTLEPVLVDDAEQVLHVLLRDYGLQVDGLTITGNSVPIELKAF